MCFLKFKGSLVTALKLYYDSKKRKKENFRGKLKIKPEKVHTQQQGNTASTFINQKIPKSTSSNVEFSRNNSAKSLTSSNNLKFRTERSILLETAYNEEEINMPAEELLELGLEKFFI